MRRDHDLHERGAATGEPRDAAAALLPSHTILLVDDEESVRKLISIALRRAGYEVAQAADGAEAIASIAAATPDLVLSDVMMPRMSGFELLAHLRADPSTQEIPVILLTARGTTDDVVAGLGLGADDYLAKPFNITELLARVRSKIERPPVPADSLPRDRRTGLLTQGPFLQAAGRELERAARSDRPGALAYIALEEVPRLRDRLGPRSEAALARQVAAVIAADAGSLELIGRDDEGRFMLLLPEFDPGSARQRLAALAQRIVQQGYSVGEERLRVTPSVGYAMFAPEAGLAELRDRRSSHSLMPPPTSTSSRCVTSAPGMAWCALPRRTVPGRGSWREPGCRCRSRLCNSSPWCSPSLRMSSSTAPG